MKVLSIAVSLASFLFVSPVFGQQPTDKPEIPAPHGAVFAEMAGTVIVGRHPIADIERKGDWDLFFAGAKP
ncbi:MAG: hypothetical protein Q8O23_03745 [Gallionella sp.]|jgi:hypothetical protein|nr:hypothetical protein [Gallionella sp.]